MFGKKCLKFSNTNLNDVSRSCKVKSLNWSWNCPGKAKKAHSNIQKKAKGQRNLFDLHHISIICLKIMRQYNIDNFQKLSRKSILKFGQRKQVWPPLWSSLFRLKTSFWDQSAKSVLDFDSTLVKLQDQYFWVTFNPF